MNWKLTICGAMLWCLSVAFGTAFVEMWIHGNVRAAEPNPYLRGLELGVLIITGAFGLYCIIHGTRKRKEEQ